MSSPRRTYSGYRVALTQHGDTLRDVAARELADASRWFELIAINSLRPPYLTDDVAEVAEGVILTGGDIIVPASADYVPASVDPQTVFGTDMILTKGELGAANGDLATVSGSQNLVQAIRHVIATELGELIHHLRYGCGAHAYIGQPNTPQIQLIVDGLVRRSVLSDARIDSIVSSSTETGGDNIRVEMVARAINGVTVNVVPD